MSFIEATLAITIGYVLANIILVSIGEYVSRDERQKKENMIDKLFEESLKEFKKAEKAITKKKGSK